MQNWKSGCMYILASTVIFFSSCAKVENPQEIAALNNNADAVMAMAGTSLPAETTTITTTTETTTTTTDPYAPFIDFDAEIDPTKPMVALSFDDGPSSNTDTILDALEANHAHATFFVVGENLNEYSAEYVKRAAAIGCEIGSHTYDHADLATLSTDQIDEEVQKTDDLVFDILGRYPYWLRPPYGSFNDTVRLQIQKPLAFWSIDTLDWQTRNTSSTVDAVLSMVEDGDIVLMHDLYEETAAAAEQIIPALVEEGYQLVTLSEMAYYRNFELQNGMVVFSLYPDDPSYREAPDAAQTTAPEESIEDETITETIDTENTEETVW